MNAIIVKYLDNSLMYFDYSEEQEKSIQHHMLNQAIRRNNLVDLDKDGYIIADETCTTKTEGVFVAGDCRTKGVRQVVTAVADGGVAATKATLYLESLANN